MIQDYAEADKIKLASASITSASLSGNNLVLKTSGGKTTTQTYNVTVSGSIKNVTPWFAENDNFIADELDIMLKSQ